MSKIKNTNQQKIADVQRILLYLQTHPVAIQDIFTCTSDSPQHTKIKARLKEIKTDLDYGKLRYYKEE